MSTRAFPLALVAALLFLTGLRPAAAAGYVRVTVSPNVILADGISTATVTAEVRGTSGRTARDGTEVRFYTTAGSITPAAFTSAGVARATLTASSVPQAANISVSVGTSQTVVTVPMVSKLIEASVGGRVLKISGQYVAFSEDKRFIQADQQVKLRYRGVEVECNSAQLDLTQNTLKALGKVQVASDDKTLIGERLWLDLKSFEGYILAVGVKKWFSAYGLTDLPEKPKMANPDFDLVDLSDSKLMWVGKQANYIVGERVQVQGARAYVGGIKSLRMPFHQANLQGGFGTTEQYVGLGSEGLSVDLPLYVRMTPGSSTAFHLGYGARSGGLGYFSRNRGLSVDLVQKYGFSGASEGEAVLSNLSSFSKWGFAWNHTQQFNQKTRLVTNFQFPEHRDLYGSVNLTSGLPWGTFQGSVGGMMPRGGRLAKTLSLAFETKPKPLAGGRFAVSGEISSFWRDAQRFRVSRGVRVPLQNVQYHAAGVKFRPRSMRLARGLSLDTSASIRGIMGQERNSFGTAFEAQLRKDLPNSGNASIGLTYNPLTSLANPFPSQGKMNATLTATYPVNTKLRLSALGTLAIDGRSHNTILQASYQVAPKWRFDFLHTMFRFGQFNNYDFELGIARSIGSRELGIYWSRREHKFIVEFGAARF